jgi:hypothetical protein
MVLNYKIQLYASGTKSNAFKMRTQEAKSKHNYTRGGFFIKHTCSGPCTGPSSGLNLCVGGDYTVWLFKQAHFHPKRSRWYGNHYKLSSYASSCSLQHTLRVMMVCSTPTWQPFTSDTEKTFLTMCLAWDTSQLSNYTTHPLIPVHT